MRAYVKPVMECEMFAANEFIAACSSYFVGCTLTPGTVDKFGGVHGKNEDGTGCCWFNNQVATIVQGRGGRTKITIEETNAPDGQGTLSGTNCSWTDVDQNGALSTGDTVTWETMDSSGQRYAHSGKIYNANVS